MWSRFARIAATVFFATVIATAQELPTAAIEVDAGKALKKIDRHLFGANIEWFHNGDQIWDPVTQANRPVLIERTKELGASLLRFPGGTLADYYHWREGVGPRQTRPVSKHGIDAGASPHNFGLHEYMDFVRRSGAEPMLQVNVATGSVFEAEDFVRYANSPTHREREENGSAAPFAVRYWEIGNEQYIPSWGQPAASCMTATDYASRFAEFATRMKSVDPEIKVGAATGVNFGRYAFVGDNDWNRILLERAGAHIDFLSVHNAYGPIAVDPGVWPIGDIYSAMLALPTLTAQNLRTINEQIVQYAPQHASRIRIGITEWGPLFAASPANPYVGHNKTLAAGVFTASMLRTFVLADRVEISNIFQLAEPLFIGIMDHNGVVKPTYLAMKLFSKHFGSTLVQSTDRGPTYNSVPVGVVDAVTGVPFVESVASISDDGRTLYVMVINKHLTSAVSTDISIRNFLPSATGSVHVLTAKSPDANNGNDLLPVPGVTWATQAMFAGGLFTQGAPESVTIQQRPIAAQSSFTYSAPPMSVSVLEFARQ